MFANFLELGFCWEKISVTLYDEFEKRYIQRWTVRCKYDVRFGFKTSYHALLFSGKMNEYLRLRYGLKPHMCRMWLGLRTIRVNAWKTDLRMFKFLIFSSLCVICSGEVALPRLLQVSLNSDLIINKKLIFVHFIFHYDAVAQETMVLLKALNPRDLVLFHKYGCSTPQVICGWAAKESNLEKLGGGVIKALLQSIKKPLKVPALPNTEVKLIWFGAQGLLLFLKTVIDFLRRDKF